MKSANKHSVLLIAAATSLFLLNTVNARVGETPDECDRRYGKATVTKIDPKSELRAYLKSDLSIAAFFEDGVCWKIIYSHPDRTPLSDAEAKAILNVYGEWLRYDNPGTYVGTLWRLPDRYLAAYIDNNRDDGSPGTRGLAVFDRRRDIRNRIKEEINANVKTKMEGL